MKRLPVVLIVLAFLGASFSMQARPVQGALSYQELFDKSDLVIIARPISTKDISERRGLPGMDAVLVVGVETVLKTSVILKGKKNIRSFVLHHYRIDAPTNAAAAIIDGPALLHFDPKGEYNGEYLLFLARESGGRYTPVSGQVDPAITSVQVLWQANLWEDVKAWREERHAKHN